MSVCSAEIMRLPHREVSYWKQHLGLLETVTSFCRQLCAEPSLLRYEPACASSRQQLDDTPVSIELEVVFVSVARFP